MRKSFAEGKEEKEKERHVSEREGFRERSEKAAIKEREGDII